VKFVVVHGVEEQRNILPTIKRQEESFCLMVEASDHGYVLHTRRIHVTRYNVVRVGYIFFSNE
jgi:hypothetical protein